MSRCVLVTACASRLGEALCRALLEHPLVSRVVGIDPRAPDSIADPRFKHHPADIRDEFLLRTIMEEEAVDTIFHMAFLAGEPRDEIWAREFSINGTLTVLEAASKSSAARKLILGGSVLAYGARRRNPEYIREDQPLRAGTLRCGIHARVMEEELAKSMPAVRKSLAVSVLRLAPIALGYAQYAGLVGQFVEASFLLTPLLRRGAVQFLAESDLLAVLLKAFEAADLRGAFNVAPDGCTTFDEACRRLGKTRVRLPYSLVWLCSLAARLCGSTRATERAVSYLAYPVVASNEKIKKALGVSFSKSSLDALAEAAAGGKTPSQPALTAGEKTMA